MKEEEEEREEVHKLSENRTQSKWEKVNTHRRSNSCSQTAAYLLEESNYLQTSSAGLSG